jgi:hypothetical protein
MTTHCTFHPNARMDSFYEACDPDLGEPCSVRIDDVHIRVEYEMDGTRTAYEGRAIVPGQYRLESPEVKGHATLHQVPGSYCLEGSWAEGVERGMWRIELHEPVTA